MELYGRTFGQRGRSTMAELGGVLVAMLSKLPVHIGLGNAAVVRRGSRLIDAPRRLLASARLNGRSAEAAVEHVKAAPRAGAAVESHQGWRPLAAILANDLT